MSGKLVAYVGSYTYIGKSKGITIFDVDEEKGTFEKRKEIVVNNSSHMRLSRDRKLLYSLSDEGIVTFKILPDGDLEYMSTADIRGMRGRHLELSMDGRFFFVAGYHDGKLTVLKRKKDGSAGAITDFFYDKGSGSIADRNFQPHLSCVRLTPDQKYLCVANRGVDQIRIFRFDDKRGKIKLVDFLRCKLDSAPRYFHFSRDGQYFYVLGELTNTISVYRYRDADGTPEFTLLQEISTLGKKASNVNAAAAIFLSQDEKHVFCSNSGDNSVAVYDRDPETGLLTQLFVLPVSGAYPKDIGLFPDGKRLYSVNFEECTITFFQLHYEERYMTMYAPPLHIDQPNRCIMIRAKEERKPEDESGLAGNGETGQKQPEE